MLKPMGVEVLSPTRKKYSFAIAGPHFQMIHISPLSGVKIAEWSFNEIVPQTGTWNGRQWTVVNYVHGISDWEFKDLDFWMIIETPERWTEPYTFDIAHAALFVHNEETKTKEFIDFTDSFPEWTNVQNWTASFIGYQY